MRLAIENEHLEVKLSDLLFLFLNLLFFFS
jgi:hypothetical protein